MSAETDLAAAQAKLVQAQSDLTTLTGDITTASTQAQKLVTDLQAVAAELAQVATDLNPAPPPPPPTTLQLGVYNGQGQGITNGMPNVTSAFATATGVPQSIARYYLDGDGTWATLTGQLSQYWAGTTAVRMNIGVPFPTQSVTAAGGISKFLAAGATGAYNAQFQTLAQEILAAGFGNAILSIWWEWDGGQGSNNVPATATDYANLAAFWNQIAPVIRAVSAQFHLAWYCGGYNYSYQSWWANCVPSAVNIDSVTLDFYDQQWSTISPAPTGAGYTQAQHTEAWTNYQLPILTWLAAEAKKLNKPLGFGEWGIWSVGTPTAPECDQNYGGDDPYWMTDFTAWLKANNVLWACYFNSGPNVIDPAAAAPKSAAAYSAAL